MTVTKSESKYLERSKMDHAVDIWMCLEDMVESLFIRDIDLEEFGLLSADELYAIGNFLGRVLQIVCNDHLVVCFEQGKGSKGSNVARSAVGASSVHGTAGGSVDCGLPSDEH